MGITTDDIARLLWILLGIMLIVAGFTGRLGDMLAALFAPSTLNDLTQ